MKKARFHIKMAPSQSPFFTIGKQLKRTIPNPFEGRLTQQEIDNGFLTLSLDQIVESYSDGQIETLLKEMHYLSDGYENECIDRLLATKK